MVPGCAARDVPIANENRLILPDKLGTPSRPHRGAAGGRIACRLPAETTAVGLYKRLVVVTPAGHSSQPESAVLSRNVSAAGILEQSHSRRIRAAGSPDAGVASSAQISHSGALLLNIR
jgi:hypothetical protein